MNVTIFMYSRFFVFKQKTAYEMRISDWSSDVCSFRSVHAIGDAANAEALDAIADLNADLPGERRWRIEHAQIVDPADIPRFKQLGVIASMQPIHQPSDRLMAEARLGPERLAGGYAWRSLEKAGVRLAFGSDVPVERARSE